jgi:hypothetical protein
VPLAPHWIGEYERILLTPTGFGVLDHLVEHAGQLVTHRQLLDAVWPRTAIEPQAVKSKVFHLPRSLDDDPSGLAYSLGLAVGATARERKLSTWSNDRFSSMTS